MSKDGVPRETFTLTFDSNSERLFLKNVEKCKFQTALIDLNAYHLFFAIFFHFLLLLAANQKKSV